VTSVTDALGNTSSIAYDPATDVRTSTTNALGQTTSYSYDTFDRLIASADPNGVITNLTYTPQSWLATSTVRANTNGTASSGDAVTARAYDAIGDLTSVTDPDGVQTTYAYDADHRPIGTTDALGNTRMSDYDAVGNLTEVANAAANSATPSWLQSYDYDAANQRVRVIDGDNHVTRDEFDVNGRLQDNRDPLAIHTLNKYDSTGNLIRLVQGVLSGDEGDGHGHHSWRGDDGYMVPNREAIADTRFQYDAQNQLIEVTDSSRLSTHYSYDPVGQLIQQQSPDTGLAVYAYDAVGNRTRSVDARQVETNRGYDALHRVTAVSYPSDPSLNATYAYDEPTSVTGCAVSYPIGHVSRMADASGTTTYCYDQRGNVIAQKRLIFGAIRTTGYAYTLANRLSQLTYPSGTMLSYSYDADGRVSGITAQENGQITSIITAVSYLPFGPVTQLTYGDGQTLARQYDRNYWGTDIDGLSLSLHIRRDGDGQIVALHEGRSQGWGMGWDNEQLYRYDTQMHLTDVGGPYGWFGSHYVYDATGDRLARSGWGVGEVTYRYTPGTHHLSGIGEVGGWSFASVLSDADGNIVHLPQNGQTIDLTYGANNRLTQALADGRVVGSYVYDANGLRAQKTVGKDSTQFIFNGQANLLGEYDESGASDREYVWLNGVVVASLDSSAQGMAIHYVGTDYLGTPRSVTDSSGHLVWSWDYVGEAFGDSRPLGSYALALRFPGQYADAETGLNYNVYRDYSPSTGRYNESDPLGLLAGPATYTYVGNNPLVDIDPFGLCPPQAKNPKNPKCKTPIMQPQYTAIFGQMGNDLGVNPLFIMSTALQESGWGLAHVYGTNSSSNGQPLNNLFGMTQAGGNNIAYSSIQASAQAWEQDWGSYLTNQPQTIQAYAADLNSNPTHMYNSNPAYPSELADRYAQLVKAVADCGVTFSSGAGK
jgi:RHS repeat-associated protein